MGSSSNRKISDLPIIQRPKSTGASGMGGSGERGLPERVAEVCLPSFEVKLKTLTAKEGENVSLLKNKSDVYEVILSGQMVATLDKKISEMVYKCEVMGVSYRGKVVRQKKEFYAQFFRTP